MSKTSFIICIVLLAAVLVAGIVILFSGNSKQAVNQTPTTSNPVSEEQTSAETQAPEAVKPSKETVKIEVLKEGTGTAVTKKGDTITVNYTGTLLDGTKFDSSIDRKQPFSFTLGAGKVIQGWDQGLIGLKVGEKVRLTIPPSLGYGAQAMGDKIPANSTLIFEVDLLAIK